MSLPLTASRSHHAPKIGKVERLSSLTDTQFEADENGIALLTSISEIELLESSWRRLTGAKAAPFQTFTWNLAWYRHFRDRYDSPMVFLFLKEGEVCAILPCYRKGRKIRLAGDLIGDYQDILASSEEMAEEALDRIFDLVNREVSAPNFFFQKLSSEGQLFSYFSGNEDHREDMITFSRFYAPCPIVSIEGGLEAYFDSLPSKRRQDMRRSLRRFDKEFRGSSVEMIRNLEIRVADLDSIAAFHSDHFRKDGVSPLADDALIGVLGEVAKDPDVGLQLSALVKGSEMLAVDVGFARGGRYYGYLTGFHEGFGKWAPGKCLLFKRIDAWVKEDEVKTLDFLSGCENYKSGFTHGEQYGIHSLHWMPNRLPCRARRVTLVAERLGRKLAKRAIRKLVEVR
ncbi:MAG: GNAT family N-acetyltransferase [Verrucomicrobiota bacterium]